MQTAKRKPITKSTRSNTKAAAGAKNKRAAVVLSSASGSVSESEYEVDSEDDTQGLQIEKVLDSRRSAADPKQQEFLVKFQGEV